MKKKVIFINKNWISRYIFCFRLLLLILFLAGIYKNSLAQDIRTSRQSGYYTYIYRINESESKKIYRKNLLKINESYFHTLVDSFPTDNRYTKNLENGHYLYVHAKGNQVQFQLISRSNVDIKILNNSSDLVLYVTDKSGKVVPDATLKINHRKVDFDNATSTYRIKHANVKGFISVNYQGMSSFYYITRQKNNSALRRTTRKVFYQTPLKYIAVPVIVTASLPFDIYRLTVKGQRSGFIYYITKPFYDIVNSISYGYPQGFIQKIVNLWNKEHETLGYMAFNKTVYRPGDTVKWKGYLTDDKKRPLKTEMFLRLYTQKSSKTISFGKVKPSKPGIFYGHFILADTLNLKLDDFCNLGLSSSKHSMSGYFKYEDYELKSTRYEATAVKSIHYSGEENTLILKGTDENNLSLADAKANIMIVPVNTEKSFGKRVFVPDTIWKTDINLNPSGDTEVKLPAEIFPNANISYKVVITFLNSSNEKVVKELRLKYCYEEDILKISLEDDSVVFERTINGVSVPGTGRVSFSKFNEVISEINVKLPYSCKLSPFVNTYSVISGREYSTKNMENEFSMVTCFSERDADSVWFTINNPRKLPLAFYVYNLNKEVYRGDGSNLSFAVAANSSKNYYMSLHYLWNNQVISENYEVPLKTAQLKISSDQPEYIYPGKKISIKLKVTDYKSEPVEGADILAYSYTAKMPAAGLPAYPDFETKRKQKELINEFFLKQDMLNLSSKTIPLNWKKWNSKMRLDSITYYQFLYPREGMFTYCYESTNSINAFISPYVVKDGHVLPVYSIFINDRIVYSHYTNVEVPYVFAAPVGRMTLRMRIPGAEITVPNLYMEEGKKYIMSFTNDTSNHFIYIQKKPYSLSETEINSIRNSLMVIKKTIKPNEFAYITQDNQIYPLQTGYSKEFVVGPFNRSNYRFQVAGDYSIAEQFEPGFRYEFKRGLVKMYSMDKNDFTSWNYAQTPRLNFSDSVITERDLLTQWQNSLSLKQANSPKYHNPTSTDAGYGKMMLTPAPMAKKSFIKNLILFKYGYPQFLRVSGGTMDVIHQLEEGTYRALILANDNSYLEADSLIISPNGLNLFNLEDNWKQPDSTSEKISNQIFEEYSKNYYTYPQEKQTHANISQTYNQQYSISRADDNVVEGIIRDAETQEPLPGVNIIVEGTTIGTVSDMDGFYRIGVPKGSSTLVYSFVGYIVERIPIGFSQFVNVSLTADIQRLEEVVVVGYGTTKKMSVTASVATVKVRGIGTLQGKVAGISTAKIYGSNAPVTINSKGILSDKALADEEFLNSLTNASALRTKFSDNAFWQPALTTDKNGEASFDVTFPDDITAWRTFYIAMGNKKSGSLQATINAFKPMAASLSVPRFLISGDSSVVIGKATNYGTDTIPVTSTFKVDSANIQKNSFALINSHIDSMLVTTSSSDSVKVLYQLAPEKGFADGEERKIPVFPQGILETEGIFETLDNDSTFVLTIPAHYKNGEIYMESNVLNIVRNEALHVHNYAYLCNEQAASKLKCLLAEKAICRFLDVNFKYHRDIKKLISRLEESRNQKYLWGWWKDAPQSMWISLHVLEALLQAQKEEYDVDLKTETIVPYLISILESISAAEKVKVLKMLQQMKSDIRVDLEAKALLKEKYLPLAVKLEAIELMQNAGAKMNIDSLLMLKKETMYGNYYWKADSFDILENYIHTTLGMYRIIRNDSTHLEYLPKIRNFFFEERKKGNWRNTFESARIIETILPDMLGKSKKLEKPIVKLNVNGNAIQVDSFPYKQKITGGDTITISKKGDFPVYISTFNRWWNSNPVPVSKGFKVSTYFKDGIAKLEAGKPVKLVAEIQVLKMASYIMVEVPIPAGCSYEEKSQYHQWEVHREYFKHKVCIFYNQLPIGIYKVEIDLLPRYNGRYILNPAKAEMMYFPVFFGRNELKKVEIQ